MLFALLLITIPYPPFPPIDPTNLKDPNAHPVHLAHQILTHPHLYDKLLPHLLTLQVKCGHGGHCYAYNFNFDLHGNPDWQTKAPWYSAMAQGMLLSVFTRANNKLLAEGAFQGLLTLTTTDAEGNLWLKEYPQDPYVLNGHIYATIGLYEYETKWSNTKLHIAALNTIYRTAPLFLSSRIYCLTHKVPSEIYHAIHLELLKYVGNHIFPHIKPQTTSAP